MDPAAIADMAARYTAAWNSGSAERVVASRGWFDAEDYARQVAG